MNGGPPAWASVDVNPDRAPIRIPLIARGGALLQDSQNTGTQDLEEDKPEGQNADRNPQEAFIAAKGTEEKSPNGHAQHGTGQK